MGIVRVVKDANEVGLEDIAFVPTMGKLHEGHLSLVKLAREYSKNVVVSIFVNEMQFGPNEDFASYPRSLEADIKALETLGFDVTVYAPDASSIYPSPPQVNFYMDIISCLCGKSRPAFFNGILQVVHRLFFLLKPRYAVFGKKDFQQYLIVKTFTEEMNLGVHVIGGELIRETTGLAMSSRNAYLSDEQKSYLSIIYRSLVSVKNGGSLSNAKEALENAGIDIDYLEIRSSKDLSLCEHETGARIFFGGYFEGVRLIDNLELN